MGRGRGKIICYKYTHIGNLEMDLQNPCTTCSYCNSFEHVIEDCPMLLAKLQEKRGGNQQVKFISAKPHREDPRVVVITKGGTITGEDRVTPRKTTK
jgi:hypothetical protein